MRALEDIYPNIFFKDRESLSWRCKPIAESVINVLDPASVIECGSSIGDLVKEFNGRGVECIGIEGSKRAVEHLVCKPENTLFLDLRETISPQKRFNLCVCLEVAEHIEEEYTDIFLDNLCSLSDRLLLSICEEGGGRHHVNLKPMEYWKDKFKKRGYIQNIDIKESIKKQLKPHFKNGWLKMIHDRLVYFYKGEK